MKSILQIDILMSKRIVIIDVRSDFFSPSLMLMRLCFLFASFIASGLWLSAAEPFETFLEQHCVRCHGPKKEKGDLRIDQLSRDFKVGLDGSQWGEIVEKINAGEMPPEDEEQPTEGEIASVIAQLDEKIREGRAARMAARPAVAHYRLSRKEYQNTVYDLLGVRYDPAKPGELNADPRWHGFERIGSQLSLSPSHVERYYRAAETVLARAFPAEAGEGKEGSQDGGRTSIWRRQATAGLSGSIRNQASLCARSFFPAAFSRDLPRIGLGGPDRSTADFIGRRSRRAGFVLRAVRARTCE